MSETKEKNTVPCPLCQGEKKSGYAVCAVHKAAYNKEAAEMLFVEKTPPSYEEWLIEKIAAALPGLEKEVETTGKNHKISADLFKQLVEDRLRQKTGNQYFDLDIINELRKKILETEGAQLRKLSGEPTAFYEKRVAQTRLEEARRILKELRQKVSQLPAAEKTASQ